MWAKNLYALTSARGTIATISAGEFKLREFKSASDIPNGIDVHFRDIWAEIANLPCPAVVKKGN